MQSNAYKLRGYEVAPLSIMAIRSEADRVRKVLRIENDPAPNLCAFLEGLVNFGITVDVRDDAHKELGAVEALTVPEQLLIVLTEATYAKAIQNDSRTRFTIFHELGHLVLSHSKTLHRSGPENVKPFQDSEWQADQFAAEITMPIELIKRHQLNSAIAIQELFEVSAGAAETRYSKLREKGLI